MKRKQTILLSTALIAILLISSIFLLQNKQTVQLEKEKPEGESIGADEKSEDVYHSLIEKYRTAIVEEWDQEQLDAEDLGPAHYTPQSLADDYGYEFRDLNGDGYLELILGVHYEDGTNEIREIYTLQDGIPTRVFSNGIRTNLSIYDDGTIQETYGMRSEGYYQIKKDGSPQLIEGYEMDQVGEYRNVNDDTEIMTEEKKAALAKKYEEIGERKHTFRPFAQEEER